MTTSPTNCAIARTMQILGGKWTMLIVRDLLQHSCRFSELEHSLIGISPRTLATRLKELELDGIVARDFSSRHPIYCLTDRGTALYAILEQLKVWGSPLISSAPLAASQLNKK